MEDINIRSILASHNSKQPKKEKDLAHEGPSNSPTVSEIPDVFFDKILTENKLTRIEILVLMYLYRKVWCKPNINKKHGISDVYSYEKIQNDLKIGQEDLLQALRSLESYQYIETIRSGQYFVRRYFTEALDKENGQSYDNFL